MFFPVNYGLGTNILSSSRPQRWDCLGGPCPVHQETGFLCTFWGKPVSKWGSHATGQIRGGLLLPDNDRPISYLAGISHLLPYQAATQLMGKWSRNSSRQSYEIGSLHFAILPSKFAFKHNCGVQYFLLLSCQLIPPKAGLVAGILGSKTIIPRCICILIDDSRESALAWNLSLGR